MASPSLNSLDVQPDVDERSEQGSDEDEMDDYRIAMSAISKNLRPDPLTGEVEFTDIIQYINTHTDDPNVRKFFGESNKRSARKKEKRRQAVATFDASKLQIQYGAAWVWNFTKNDDEKELEERRKEPPQQTFQMYCYIREGPEAAGGDDPRHVDQFIGLPTSQQVEDFIKVCMAAPMECWTPCIPQTLLFTHNLMVHQRALLPFLYDLPMPFSFMFQPADMRDRVQERDYKRANETYTKYIEFGTRCKEEGNAAYERGDRQEAVAQFEAAAEGLERLLLKAVSAQEARDAETRRLLAICYANCAAARMLLVDGEKDLKGAVVDAEKAITADPAYPKGYVRLSRAQEAIGNVFEAQEALVRGLRHKELEKHYGLADHLISLQTDGKGLKGLTGVEEFEGWLNVALAEDKKSAEMMKGLQGAWKRRCDDHRKNISGAGA